MNALLAVLNIFIDPAASVGYQEKLGKTAWILPFVISVIAMMGTSYLQLPIMVDVIRNHPGPNMTAQEAEASATMVEKFGFVGLLFSPIMLAIMLLISSGLSFGFSRIFNLGVSFPSVFSLLSHASLITMLASVTHIVVLKLKGSINSVAELRPAFGLDLLLADGANRFLVAFLNYFSFFTLWYIVVLALGFAALGRTSKSTALVVTAPVWMIGLVLALFGAAFG